MKNNYLSKIIFLFNLCFFLSHHATARQLKVSIPKMPVHAETEHKGVLVDFAKVLAKKLQQDISIQIVPFSRSIYYVSTNKVDFHLPFIKTNIKPLTKKVPLLVDNTLLYKKADENSDNFIYSDETIFYVNFVLYSHKYSTIDINKIMNYKIETDSAHLPFLKGMKMASDCILCSLKKVQHKLTDGYIFADSSTDPLLRENKALLSAIKRELYQRFEVKLLFPNTEKGQKLNKKISAIITEMRLLGELEQLLSTVNFPYEDWQL